MRNQLVQSCRLHKRLISQHNQGGTHSFAQRLQSRADGRSHALLVLWIHDHSYAFKPSLAANFIGSGAQHQHNLARTRCADVGNGVFQQGLPRHAEQLFRLSHAA